MDLKRCVISAAALAGCVFAVAAPAGAAVAAAPKSTGRPWAASTSWPSPRLGIVLSYPARTPGARPALFLTGNAGRTWRKLPPPPVPYPADNDTPDATWSSSVIAVTDGTRVVVSDDAGLTWSRVRLAGVPAAASRFVGHITIADGRMFTLVTTTSAGGTSSAAVYSGPVWGATLRPVRGLSVSGGITYGDISAVGGLQVFLGSDYTSAHYWLSRFGVRFVPAPPPCPATGTALLGGIRNGRPIALCSSSPSSVTLGQNAHQVRVAPRPGGRFAPSGPAFAWGNQQAFAAASDRNMTMASPAGLYVTSDAGRTWATVLPQPNGGFWHDLAFPGATAGVVVDDTVSSSLRPEGTVYRTTDAGRSWSALSLP